jgi:hypothetical protein
MIKCTKCKIEKSSAEFHNSVSHAGGKLPRCKVCHNEQVNKRIAKELSDQGGYAVYYLPEHHYVGMTNNTKDRMRKHKRKGRYVDDMEIIGVYSSPIEAHFVETLLHLIGYEGFNNGNNR